MSKVCKILITNVFLLFAFNFSVAEVTYVDVNAKGKSESYEISLKKALKEAISKVNGVSLKTESVLETIDKSITTNEGSSGSLARNLNEKNF